MRLVRVVLWVLCAAYWVALFTLTHLPRVPVIGPPVQDKVAHLLAYGVLAGVLYLTTWASGSGAKRAAYFVIAVTVLYGAMDELTQPLVGRSCEWYDWLADAAGALTVVGVFTSIRYFIERAGRGSAAAGFDVVARERA
jgi:VanZ family protein